MNRALILSLLVSACRKATYACERTRQMVRNALAAFLAWVAIIDKAAAA